MRKKLAICFTAALMLVVPCAVKNLSDLNAEAESSREIQSLKELQDTDISDIASWKKYDSRDYGLVTPVRDQEDFGICWAMASIAAMETSILRAGLTDYTAETLDLEEFEAVKAAYGKWDDPLDLSDEHNTEYGKMGRLAGENIWVNGGKAKWIENTASRWQGIYQRGTIKSEYKPIGVPNEGYGEFVLYESEKCDMPYENSEKCIQNIKNLVAKRGAVAFEFYTQDVNTYYVAPEYYSNHVATIIGWDDEISKDLFESGNPSRDGAWIVKNSWGAEEGDDGYLYLSYDSFVSEVYAFEMREYQDGYSIYARTSGNGRCTLDTTGMYIYNSDVNDSKAAVIEETLCGKEEEIRAVSIGFTGYDVTFRVEIYTDISEENLSYGNDGFNPCAGKLASTGTYHADNCGYHTVVLNQPVVTDGKYAIVVSVDKAGGFFVELNGAYEGIGAKSYLYTTGDGGMEWENLDRYFNRYFPHIRPITYTAKDVKQGNISLASANVSAENAEYTGAKRTPEVKVELNGKILQIDKDFTVEYRKNLSVGTAEFTVKGIGEYCGEKQGSFQITRADISDSIFFYICGIKAGIPKFLKHHAGLEFKYDGVEHEIFAKALSGCTEVVAQVRATKGGKASLREEGEYQFTAEVDTENYYGTATCTITVSADAVERLPKLKQDLLTEYARYEFPDFSAEYYVFFTQIKTFLDSFTEEENLLLTEKEMMRKNYLESIVERWKNAVDGADKLIETYKDLF